MTPEAVNHPSWTKRVPVDFSAPMMDAMRDWKILFGALAPKKEEYVVRSWKHASAKEDKLDFFCLSNTFWEQGLLPNDYVVLYPISCLKKSLTVKSALSAALISGWLLKSNAPNTGMGTISLRKTSTLRQTSKKPYFFVLRNSTCLCFKTDSKTEKLHKVILFDYYRTYKDTMPDGRGYALRLELWETGFSALNAMYVLHSQAESDVDAWFHAVLMVQKPALPVFGVSLLRVVNRPQNVRQYCPDFLDHLLSVLRSRIEAKQERWRCLASADAKPPAELKEVDSRDKLPPLEGHADTACAAALRAYLLGLPEPLIKPDFFLLLDFAREEKNVAVAASAFSFLGSVQRHTLELVLKLLRLVPAGKLHDVCRVWGPAVAGSAHSVQETSDVLQWILEQFSKVTDKANASLDLNKLRDIAKKRASIREQADGGERGGGAGGGVVTGGGGVGGSSAPPPPPEGPLTTAAFKFDARSPKELSVEAGESLRVIQTIVSSGWALVARTSDDTQGLVPINYLSRLEATPRLPLSPRLSSPHAGSPIAAVSDVRRRSNPQRNFITSPRDASFVPSEEVDPVAEEKLCARYNGWCCFFALFVPFFFSSLSPPHSV